MKAIVPNLHLVWKIQINMRESVDIVNGNGTGTSQLHRDISHISQAITEAETKLRGETCV